MPRDQSNNKHVEAPTEPMSAYKRLSSDSTFHSLKIPVPRLRGLALASASIATTAIGARWMSDIFMVHGWQILDIVILFLFAVSFCWISIAFWSAGMGFLLQMLKRDPITLQRSTEIEDVPSAIQTRTAILMPIFNEEIVRMISGFESNLRSILKTGEEPHFDFFLLSDTNDLNIAAAEQVAWQQLMQRYPHLEHQLFYRRRPQNTQGKVGNITDFCQRWGNSYDFFIVLDADSLMTGECILKLVRRMQAQTSTGLIQTVPLPVRQTTFFGRFIQFAANLYNPMLSTGFAFWQTTGANYWGHNAIVRTKAFIAHCGLPTLPGAPPFGGAILSHDFVEAALLRRAGWDVFLSPELAGSFEEVPSNLIDYAKRDRRWLQGNFQHLGLLAAKGLSTISRVHFVLGAVAFLSSLLWLTMMGLTTVIDMLHSLVGTSSLLSNEGKSSASRLLILTAVLLLLPKFLGMISTLCLRRKEFGGALKILSGATLEILFAIILAPIMMAFHSYFILSLLMGHQVTWGAQQREGRSLSWKEAYACTAKMSFIALIWGITSAFFAPTLFLWVIPVLLSLSLAAPILRYSSSASLGNISQQLGAFITPEIRMEPTILCDLRQLQNEYQTTLSSGIATAFPPHMESMLPAEQPCIMPIQEL